MRGEHFDGHGAIEAGVARLVNLAHAARADQRLDLIDAEPIARLQTAVRERADPAVGLERVEQFDRGLLRKTPRILVCGEQRLDLRLQRAIVTAQLAHARRALVRRPLQNRLKDLLDPIPSRPGHDCILASRPTHGLQQGSQGSFLGSHICPIHL